MNAILLGAASFGALIAIFTADSANLDAVRHSEDVGSMTHTTLVDPGTGETTEISVISFVD